MTKNKSHHQSDSYLDIDISRRLESIKSNYDSVKNHLSIGEIMEKAKLDDEGKGNDEDMKEKTELLKNLNKRILDIWKI